MALAVRELELVLIARDHASATIARVGGAMVILGGVLAAVGVKAASELKDMAQEAVEFRQQMALAVTQADNLGANIENVSAIVERVGNNINVPFEELSESLFDIFSTLTEDQLSSLSQAEGLLAAFARSAVAGQAPVKDIGRSVIAWINALDQPATMENVNRLLDIQFELVRKGAGTYTEFAGEVGKAIPAFVAGGQKVETFGGALAFLTKNGLNAAMAATSAARAVELMFTPKAIQGLADVGINVENSAGNFRQMNEIIRDLIPVFNGLSASQKKIKFKEIFGTGRIQARRFFDLAIPNIAEFEQLVQDMELSTGEAAKAFEFMFSQPLSQLELFSNRWESFRREIGDQLVATLETRVFPALSRLWNWWQKLDPAIKNQIAKWASWGASIMIAAGALIIVLGILVLLTALFSAFAGEAGGALVGLGKLVSVLGWIGVILAIIAFAAYLIFKNWDKIFPFLVAIWDKIKQAMGRFVEANKKFFDEVVKKAKQIWDRMLKLGKAMWKTAKTVWNAIWKAIWSVMLVFWKKWGKDILSAIKRVWEGVKNVFLNVMDVIIGILDFFIAAFEGNWEGAWESVKGILRSAWEVVKGIFRVNMDVLSQIWRILWDLLKAGAKAAWEAIISVLKGIWNKIKDIASSIWQGILNFFKGIWESITGTAKDTISGTGGLLEFFQNLPGRIIDAIASLIVLMIEWGGKIIGAMLEGTISAFGIVLVWWLDLPFKILGAIPDMVSLLWNVGKTILRGLWNGIKWIWSTVVFGWISGLGQRIILATPDMLRLLWNVGKTILQGLYNGIKWVWNNLLQPWGEGIGDAVNKAIGNVASALFQAGKDILNGLWNGMKDVWSRVARWLGDKVRWIGDKFRGILRIFSPSKVMVDIGKQTMKGLQIGLEQGFRPVNLAIDGIIDQMLASNSPTTMTDSLKSTTTTNFNDHGQTFQFGDIVSNADPLDIAAEIGWQVRMQ